jgi:hypothetical protein
LKIRNRKRRQVNIGEKGEVDEIMPRKKIVKRYIFNQKY